MEIVKAIANVFFHVVRVFGVFSFFFWNINIILNYEYSINIVLWTMFIASIQAIAITLFGHWGLQKIDPERPNLPFTPPDISTGQLALTLGILGFGIHWFLSGI